MSNKKMASQKFLGQKYLGLPENDEMKSLFALFYPTWGGVGHLG